MMPDHSFGPTCAYYEEPTNTKQEPNQPPNVKAQFFYVSALPIDDPLSPLPPQTDSKQHPPQPFSARDNAALEEAWRSFPERTEDDKTSHHGESFRSFPRFNSPRRPLNNLPERRSVIERKEEAPRVMLSQQSENGGDAVKAVDLDELAQEREAIEQDQPQRRRKLSPFRHRSKDTQTLRPASSHFNDGPNEEQATSSDTNISGRPFARAPSYRKHPFTVDGAEYTTEESERSTSPPRSRLHNAIHPHHDSQDTAKKAFVPVGVSRLHLVEMPAMLMKPIYWNPINDISDVTRGTWFYTDSMLPLEQDLAVELETGYLDMKPWTDVWQEELNAIVKSGDADAELKVMHKLWPARSSRPSTAGQFSGDIPATEVSQPATGVEKDTAALRPYQKSSVVYINAKDAQILRPSLLPSVTRSRKPLGAIRKGRQIGVPVVRGFDRAAYEKLHGQSMTTKAAQAKVGAYMNQSGDATTTGRHAACPACKSDEEDVPKVTDLVLVIHGIGQKLSERVDSYHFTHAINGFRREVNVELADQATKGVLREDVHGGIMVLPINWRLMVDFEDKVASADPHGNDFRLKDITPDSLPAVRGLISDVMLDIPYYLSHHKEKMTAAVIKEANRVYRLWCRNNPGFQEQGRVHLIAHSLGSVMALDILSQQMTKVSASVFTDRKVSDKTFDFNTTTLFSCGSPSGFFLLLNKANLLPRKGINKPGMEGEDLGRGIAGEAGTYGCLAVSNLFNIAHRNDPVAYLLNSCVDAEYARSLVPAYIPSATSSFFKKVGNAVWWGSSFTPSATATYNSKAPSQRPTIKQLPSTVEMETHNFTREEIAEKRMLLLNDNGQIDLFLNPGGIQYLDMLGAHSSYWISQDFVRFLVMEIGREQGREGTLPVLRAMKKREWKKGSIA